MENNGVLTIYKLDTNKFTIGEAFEFYLGTNNYVNAILREINVEHQELTFITLNGAIIVKLEENSFYMMEVYENDTVFTPAHFRKLKPSYNDVDNFNWE